MPYAQRGRRRSRAKVMPSSSSSAPSSIWIEKLLLDRNRPPPPLPPSVSKKESKSTTRPCIYAPRRTTLETRECTCTGSLHDTAAHPREKTCSLAGISRLLRLSKANAHTRPGHGIVRTPSEKTHPWFGLCSLSHPPTPSPHSAFHLHPLSSLPVLAFDSIHGLSKRVFGIPCPNKVGEMNMAFSPQCCCYMARHGGA
jgi:hypothetical protein